MEKTLISRIKTIIEIQKRKFARKSLLQQLMNYPDEGVIKMAEIIEFCTRGKKWTNEEKEGILKVEKIRKNYLKSSDVITMKDFGAGDSTSERTIKQMNNGVEIRRVISDICKSASTQRKWGEIIFKIIRTFQPGNCLELGTSLGISAAYQIMALKFNNKGNLITLEGAEELARIAEKNLKNLEYENFSVKVGKFNDLLPTVLSKEQPVDFAFIDGHHDKYATKAYFEQIYPFLSKKSLLIFDDISWSQGMTEVWEEIYRDHRIKVSFDMYKWGICLIDADSAWNDIRCFKISI